MPFYEYECTSCSAYTEVLQKITDAPLRKCPTCGRNTLKKLVSAPVFRLKGGGWYETDFKSEQEKRRNLASADQEPARESKPAAEGGEAKPAEPKPTESKPAETAQPARKPKPAPVASSRAKTTPARKAAARPAGARAKGSPARKKARR